MRTGRSGIWYTDRLAEEYAVVIQVSRHYVIPLTLDTSFPQGIDGAGKEVEGGEEGGNDEKTLSGQKATFGMRDVLWVLANGWPWARHLRHSIAGLGMPSPTADPLRQTNNMK